jgi:uncharacterized membrane protein YdbT with pleckstrin-like domain
MPHLLAGESLVLPTLHRHWVLLARDLIAPLLGGAALIVLVDVGLARAGLGSPNFELIFTLVVLAGVGLWVLVAWLKWASAALTVTDQRVILEEGIFQRSSKVIPLERVQDVATNQTLLGRILNYGQVEIDAAGAKGAEIFPYVGSPETLRDQVFVLSEQLRRGL